MGLEAASFIDGLNSAWPLGTDSATAGDDHFRLVKSVLKSTFPGAGGNGFNQQILATEEEINFLQGVTSPIAAALAGSTFPVGTILPFYNAAAPPGWTIVSVPTSHMLVVGSVAGGSSGGVDSPLVNNKVSSHTHTAGSGTTSSDGDHAHTFSPSNQLVAASVVGAGNISGGAGFVEVESVTLSTTGAHTHTISGVTIAANTGAADWTPLYLGLILCSKD